MSDKKKHPKIPPPDDFSKTTPNINISGDEDISSNWEKTSTGMPSQAPADDWGKTVINYDVSSNDFDDDDDDDDIDNDFSKTHYSNNSPKEPDWGMTQANVNLNNDFGSELNTDDDDFGRSEEENYGATTPYFKLPEAERKKYQDLPPTPTEKAKEEEEKNKKSGGIPMWFWASAALMTMFSFAIIVLIGGYFIFFGKSGFEVVIENAKPGSQVLVGTNEGASCCWGVSAPDGTIRIYNLKAGSRPIIVRKTGFKDYSQTITGDDGEVISITVAQENSAPPAADCGDIKAGEINKAEKCANQGLDNLSNPPNLDELIKALNLYYINFDRGSHAIPSARLRFLKRAASYIKQLPTQVVIEVGGHTDSDGSDSNNQGLSERRANSVKQALIKFGVSESMLQTKGYGETQPRPGNTNSTDDEKFQNRRIEYKAIKR